MSEPTQSALVTCQRHGCGHPIGAHGGSEWGEKCSECPCPDYWSGKYPLHDCDEDGVCAPDCRTCATTSVATACCGRPAPGAGHDHWPCCEEHGCCDGEPHDG